MIEKIYQKGQETLRHFFLFTLGSIARRFVGRDLPQNANGKVLVHIGCGDLNDKRFINLDTRPGWHIHVVDEIQNIDKQFPKNYADLIYACHILEHIPYAQVPGVLKKVRSRLKPGGVFRIAVPNFAVIVRMYEVKQNVADILAPLMGGQGYPDNFHRIAYDKKYLTQLLREAGFSQISEWDPKTAPYHTFADWAGRTISLYEKEWPISLNLEATK